MRGRYDPAMKIRPVDVILLLALIAGGSFYATHWIAVGGWPEVAWKGAGVALLAAWAFASGRPWIGLVLAFGALGDVLLEVAGLSVGALAFMAGHILAAGFYWQNRTGPVWLAAAVASGVGLASWLLTGNGGVTLYGTWLGVMAGTALTSRFRLAGLGAVLFVLSDLLIFAQMGPLAASPLPGLLIWPTYFAGQALIAWSVVRSRNHEDLHDRL